MWIYDSQTTSYLGSKKQPTWQEHVQLWVICVTHLRWTKQFILIYLCSLCLYILWISSIEICFSCYLIYRTSRKEFFMNVYHPNCNMNWLCFVMLHCKDQGFGGFLSFFRQRASCQYKHQDLGRKWSLFRSPLFAAHDAQIKNSSYSINVR